MSNRDHYSILGIASDASDGEIKKAFWSMAKKFHPDKNPGDEKSAEQKFRQIRESYEILIDQESRRAYDQMLQTIQQHNRDDFMEKMQDDPAYSCRMILIKLIKHEKHEAISIYESLISKNPDFVFDSYMSYADIMDCEFLLAEAYHQAGNLSKAAILYEKILEYERRKPYFRHFAQEIGLMLKDVYLRQINMSKHSKDILDNVEKISLLGISRREYAWICKKAGEAYYNLGDLENAARSLRKAFQLNPKLLGAKRITKKLGMEEEIRQNFLH